MDRPIGPGDRNAGTTAIGQRQQEMWLAFMPELGEDLEHLAFEGVVRTGHPYLGGEISEVGSLL
jgi:hypothetical protein